MGVNYLTSENVDGTGDSLKASGTFANVAPSTFNTSPFSVPCMLKSVAPDSLVPSCLAVDGALLSFANSFSGSEVAGLGVDLTGRSCHRCRSS
jgi:hypothetical protein